ncbi:MAG: hypothetical protein KDB14_26630 [Planctomycetales bacterium]|nr:hypothetical protein [Planctomycetales bacterium]
MEGELELLFVRHGDARRRKELSYLRKLLQRPFDDYGATAMGSDDDSTFVLPQPPSGVRYAVVARFPSQDWCSIFCDSATIDEILEANAAVGKVHFARFRYDDSARPISVKVTAGKKTLGCFEQGASARDYSVTGDRDTKEAVAACASSQSALRAFRQHFELQGELRSVVEDDTGLRVIDEQAMELDPNVCAVLFLEGRNSPRKGAVRVAVRQPAANDGRHKTSLAAALMRLNPDEVRQAIDQGADVAALPDSDVSPLLFVMQRFDSAGARGCAEALLAAGAEIGELVVECAGNPYSPAQALARVEFLLERGGDVNARAGSGQTAIGSACQQRNVELVRRLVDRGADPCAVLPRQKITAVEWVREQIEVATPSRREAFREILSVLTGGEVEHSADVPLDEVLLHENERFRFALRGQQLLAALPESLRLEEAESNRLDNNGAFAKLDRELQAEGFHPNGCWHECVAVPTFMATYTNPQLGMDAVISDRWWTREVSCRVLGYGEDGSLFSVGNVSNPADPDFDPEYLHQKECLRCRPTRLVAELGKLAKQHGAELLPTPIDAFAVRYVEAFNRILADTKTRIRSAVDRGIMLDVDGQPLLFERRGLFLDFSGYSDADYSSCRLAKCELHDLREGIRIGDVDRLTSAVRSAVVLLAMSRLQYAGAPADGEFIALGCQAATQLARILRTAPHEPTDSQVLDAFGMAALLFRFAGDASGWQAMCDSVQPAELASAAGKRAGRLELAAATLLIAFSASPLANTKLSELRKRIESGKSRRAKQLLKAHEALEHGEGKSFLKCLRQSVKLFAAQADPAPHSVQLDSKFAIPESILYTVGDERGLVADAPLEMTDWLLIHSGRGGDSH